MPTKKPTPRSGDVSGNKNALAPDRDESLHAPAVPPYLSHFWPVTARGYSVRGNHPLPPTCRAGGPAFFGGTLGGGFATAGCVRLSPPLIRWPSRAALLFHVNACKYSVGSADDTIKRRGLSRSRSGSAEYCSGSKRNNCFI